MGWNTEILAAHWFVLHVRTGFEQRVAFSAEVRGYETFVPTYSVRKRWSDRTKISKMPLFPGYVFCRLRPDLVAPILTIPFVMRAVGCGKALAPVDESEVRSIQTALAAKQEISPCPYVKAGTKVVIRDGPLCGVHGIVQATKSGDRLILSVGLLRRSVAVHLDRTDLEVLVP